MTRTSGDSPPLRRKGPLDGILVLDLTRILAGPYMTQLLGDYGAEVIKIERPGTGDDTRRWGPPFVKDAEGRDTTESAYYLCANRNKRSLAVDLSTPEGAGIVRRLAARADVLAENFRPGSLKKFGLDYESLRRVNPRLIYCSISGWGQTGPNRDKPGYDLMAQGFGGIMSLTGEPDGEPMKVGVAVADVVCGLYAATAILAALHHRERTGKGQHIDIALMDTQVSWLVNAGLYYLVSGEEPPRLGNAHPNIVPYQVFACADGHVIVAVGNDAQFARFCEIIGMPALARDPRFATNAARVRNRNALIPLLAERLRTMARDDIVARLEAAGVPAGPVNRLSDVFASGQVAARGMKIAMPHPLAGEGEVSLIGNPVKFSETPVTYRYPPPLCGEHTRQLLREFGLDPLSDVNEGENEGEESS
jgi:crotonobetainyl-CoA:carnitine CoA-transferase CaiB-like acyl-CoA transferase